MRRFFAIFFLLFAGCSGPKIVPDRELVDIFHDIYLTNAYVEQNLRMDLDSLSIYEPVFARHGYTSEDIRYTIGNFAKRKSASLSEDIVGRALEMLKKEGSVYTRTIAAQDSVANMAREKFLREVLSRDEIAVRRIADTGRLRLSIPARAGSYKVEYNYLIDSTDENTATLRTNIYARNSRNRNVGNIFYRLGRSGRGSVSQIINTDTTARSLVIDLNGYPTKDMKRPSMHVDSLRVTYYLPTEEAVDSLQREWFDYFVRDFMVRNADGGLVEMSKQRNHVLK